MNIRSQQGGLSIDSVPKTTYRLSMQWHGTVHTEYRMKIGVEVQSAVSPFIFCSLCRSPNIPFITKVVRVLYTKHCVGQSDDLNECKNTTETVPIDFLCLRFAMETLSHSQVEHSAACFMDWSQRLFWFCLMFHWIRIFWRLFYCFGFVWRFFNALTVLFANFERELAGFWNFFLPIFGLCSNYFLK